MFGIFDFNLDGKEDAVEIAIGLELILGDNDDCTTSDELEAEDLD